MLLSVDMVRHAAAGHIQHAIVLAGDSDFIPAIEAVKESGATVSLWFGEANTIHKDLVKLADITHVLDHRKFPTQGKLLSLGGGKKKEQPKERERTNS